MIGTGLSSAGWSLARDLRVRSRQPDRRAGAQPHSAKGDDRLPLRIDRSANRRVTRRRNKRCAHQPGGQPGIPVDGEIQAARRLRTGAWLGCLPLLASGQMGRSIDFGASLPGQSYSIWTVLLGEVATTFGLIASLCVFLALRELRRCTPAMIPFLYAIMVPLEADISGTSTNPARSLGPAIVSQNFDGWWIYWVGPFLGTVLAIFACSFLASRIEEAKGLSLRQRSARGLLHDEPIRRRQGMTSRRRGQFRSGCEGSGRGEWI